MEKVTSDTFLDAMKIYSNEYILYDTKEGYLELFPSIHIDIITISYIHIYGNLDIQLIFHNFLYQLLKEYHYKKIIFVKKNFDMRYLDILSIFHYNNRFFHNHCDSFIFTLEKYLCQCDCL